MSLQSTRTQRELAQDWSGRWKHARARSVRRQEAARWRPPAREYIHSCHPE